MITSKFRRWSVVMLVLIGTINISYTQDAPTELEAKSFIKKYIEAFPQNNGASGEKNDVEFLVLDDGTLLMIYSNYLPYAYQGIYTFSLGDIESIILDKESYKGNNCNIVINIRPDSHALFTIQDYKEEKLDKAKITIGKASFTENYPERIKKALEHLSKLKGATIVEDKF